MRAGGGAIRVKTAIAGARYDDLLYWLDAIGHSQADSSTWAASHLVDL